MWGRYWGWNARDERFAGKGRGRGRHHGQHRIAGTVHSECLDRAFRTAAANTGMDRGRLWPAVEEKVLPMFADVPMKRVGTLEEIADAIAFLVSPRASYITGTNLRLDGGMWPGV